MRILGYFWAVLENLIFLAIVLGMFRVAETRFEIVVVGGLTLIYLAVISSAVGSARIQIESIHLRTKAFIRLARLLNDPTVGELEQELKDFVENSERYVVEYYISFVFRVVIALIALWKLGNAVL
jgi:hypothetical protein